MSHADGESMPPDSGPEMPADAGLVSRDADSERLRRFLSEDPRPAMLPPVVKLVGRDEDLKRLRRLLDQDRASYERRRMPARVSIAGVAGVGKSAVGTRFAYSLADEYLDGVLYVNLNYTSAADGILDISQILRTFLLELGQSPDQLPQDAREQLRYAFIKATDEKRLIIFLDNVRNYQSVQDLVPRSSTCLVILTSQERLDEDIQSLQLDPLPVAAAVELFNTIAPSRNVADPELSAQLVEVLQTCAGLPIAIVVLAARLELKPGYTLARILADLDRYRSQLTTLFGAQRGKIEACFRVGYDALNTVQSIVFRRLSVVPGESFDVRMAGFLGDLADDDARLILDQLRELQLLQQTQDPDYFTMHSLLRQFAREQLTDAEAAEQLTGVLRFFWDQAKAMDQVIRSRTPAIEGERAADYAERVFQERNLALEWMEKQHKNLVAAIELACKDKQAGIAWETCRALVEFFEIRGKWESWRQTHEATEKIVPRQSIGFAYVSYGLGRFHGSRHHWAAAIDHYRTAITVFLQHGDQLGVGRSLNSLGDVYRYSRNWDAAENCFRRSISILVEAGEARQVAIAKRSMAAIYRLRGSFKDGKNLCLEAIASLEMERDERWLAATKLSLADIYLDSGTGDARSLLTECLPVFDMFRDTHWMILSRRSLADALREDGEYDAAMTELVTCRESLRQDHDDQWEGEVLHSMGLVHLVQQDVAPAITLFGEALARFNDSKDTLWQGRTHMSIGRAAAAAGRADEAQAAYHAAWPLLVEQGAKNDLERLEGLMGTSRRPPGRRSERDLARDGGNRRRYQHPGPGPATGRDRRRGRRRSPDHRIRSRRAQAQVGYRSRR
jgi:tetratricopeptide (TPR) repeat protein